MTPTASMTSVIYLYIENVQAHTYHPISILIFVWVLDAALSLKAKIDFSVTS